MATRKLPFHAPSLPEDEKYSLPWFCNARDSFDPLPLRGIKGFRIGCEPWIGIGVAKARSDEGVNGTSLPKI